MSGLRSRRQGRNAWLCVLIGLSMSCAWPLRAATGEEAALGDSSWFAVHGQFTYTEQETGGFAAPYHGPNSLSPNSGRETTDATLYLGVKPWSGAELWINPEIDQGFGLDDTLGVAGFTSGEAYKVGRKQPYLRLQRAFVRQTVDMAGDQEPTQGGANQFAGPQAVNRWVFTIGKFSVVDVFDNNQYAHDPRGDFLNWSAIDAGSFDYAADAWGYSVGGAVEWYRGAWTVRGGVFDLSDVPNSERLDAGFHEFQMVGELEHRHEIAGRAGKLMVTVFDTRGRMGLLDRATQTAAVEGAPVDIAAARHYRSRLGLDLNIEQELVSDLGYFARIGKAAGNVETFDFTDIDRTAAMGLSLKGSAWHRAQDTVGLALIDNNSSAARQRFLDAGGLGILVGDGRLPHPGPEEIVETYYSAALFSFAQLTFDYQRVQNPAYNRDRGPASVFAVRVHVQI